MSPYTKPKRLHTLIDDLETVEKLANVWKYGPGDYRVTLHVKLLNGVMVTHSTHYMSTKKLAIETARKLVF